MCEREGGKRVREGGRVREGRRVRQKGTTAYQRNQLKASILWTDDGVRVS